MMFLNDWEALLNEMTAGYNNSAREYSKSSNDEKNITKMHKLVGMLLKEIKLGGRVLDCGCGDGRDASYITSNGVECVGLDLSEELLNIAQERAPKAVFELMDFTSAPLPYEDDYFDGALYDASLLHVHKAKAPLVLDDAYRMLKSDGVLAIFTKKRKEGMPEWETEECTKYGSPFIRYNTYYYTDELEDLVIQSGFNIIRLINEDDWINLFAEVKKAD